MDKRFQVFISSTYADLKEERQKVIQTVMETDCIPAGMELFPAADEEQWKFIQRVIDDCDYYILIIGGRYGSLTDEGVSYTRLLHKPRACVTQATAFRVARACRSSVSSLSLLFMERISLPAGRMMRPAR